MYVKFSDDVGLEELIFFVWWVILENVSDLLLVDDYNFVCFIIDSW